MSLLPGQNVCALGKVSMKSGETGASEPDACHVLPSLRSDWPWLMHLSR